MCIILFLLSKSDVYFCMVLWTVFLSGTNSPTNLIEKFTMLGFASCNISLLWVTSDKVNLWFYGPLISSKGFWIKVLFLYFSLLGINVSPNNSWKLFKYLCVIFLASKILTDIFGLYACNSSEEHDMLHPSSESLSQRLSTILF